MTIIEILKIREITRGNPDCESNHINSRTKTSIQKTKKTKKKMLKRPQIVNLI